MSNTGCVFQRFPANPSQESLSLSISGSGSLHSWNLETTEELSDLTEDCLYLDTSVPEEEGTESLVAVCEMGEQERGQREHREKQEEVKVEVNGNQAEEIDDTNNFKEVRLEEERKKEDQDKRKSLVENPVEEIAETQEERLKEMRENEINQNKEVAEGEDLQTNENQKVVARAEEEKENQEDKEVTTYVNELIKLTPPHLNIVEEQHRQEDTLNPETTASPGPQSLSAESEPPAEIRSEEAVKTVDGDMRQTPPKVRSAVARFQSQASSQGFQVKSRTKGLVEPGRPCNTLWVRENAQTHSTCDSNIPEENNCSEAQEEEDRPLIKVSELKKRFEA